MGSTRCRLTRHVMDGAARPALLRALLPPTGARLSLIGASDREPDVVWSYRVDDDPRAPALVDLPGVVSETFELELVEDSVGVPGPTAPAWRDRVADVPLRIQLERLVAHPGTRDELVAALGPMFAAAPRDDTMPLYLAHTVGGEPDVVWVLVVFRAGVPSIDGTAAARRETGERIMPSLAASDVWRVALLGQDEHL